MLYPIYRSIPALILATITLVPIFCQCSYANESSLVTSPRQTLARIAPLKIAQTPEAELQRRLQEQREAERVLKDGERLKREIRDNDYHDRHLKEKVGEEVNKVRESGSNPQKVREAETELNKLRQQNNRHRNDYVPFHYPYYPDSSIIFAPGYSTDPNYPTPTPAAPSNNRDSRPETVRERASQNDPPRDAKNPNLNQVLVSGGFKDGKIAPSIGFRYNSIGFEIGGIFNQDSLPGSVNDFSLPSNFLFNDLGVKKLSPQWGGDVLGFLAVDPRVSIYGSVGLYFQSRARIAQSQATNDLYKQTDDSNVTGAVGGGVTYSAADSISIGVGYHSLRGLTARMGISF
jgi:hypothetical protein